MNITRNSMNMTKCVGCGRQVNAQMIACPDCGKPVGYSGGTPLPDPISAQRGVSGQRNVGIPKDTPPQREALAQNSEGQRLLGAGKYEEAIAALTEAIDLHPGLTGAYRSRAQAYQRLGREEEAKADLELVASRTPSARQPTPEEYDFRGRRWESSSEDVVGTGRYVLSFLLAGFIGLAIQYALRKKGWMATWINAVIFVVGIIALSAIE